jgi:ABC-2 type transport system permease protein
MTAASDIAAPAQPAPKRKVAPFLWSVRRELWEHGGVTRAPLIVGGIALLACMYASRWVPTAIRTIQSGHLPTSLGSHMTGNMVMGGHHVTAAQFAAQSLAWPFDAIGLVVCFTAVIVGLFYCLSSLNTERRDRTVLFWKSLPVSDRTTVLSKAMVPVVILPLVAWLVTWGLHILLLVFETAVVAATGLDPATLWGQLDLQVMWICLPYGLLVLALWMAPVAAYLMVVSAWARSMTFVWAIAPPAALAIFEILAFRTDHIFKFIMRRLTGGFAEGFSTPEHQPITQLSQIDPVRNFVSLELWGGLVFAAAALAACVWLRRRRDPV